MLSSQFHEGDNGRNQHLHHYHLARQKLADSDPVSIPYKEVIGGRGNKAGRGTQAGSERGIVAYLS